MSSSFVGASTVANGESSQGSTAKSMLSLNRYVKVSINSVPGFMLPLDAEVIHGLLSYQAEADIQGPLCEIGVHHGRLFLMLALARRAGERALAVDLFEDDELNANGKHAGRDRAMFQHAKRLGIPVSDEEAFKTSSLDVKPEDLLARANGRIRFFSVDGGHLYVHVENDLKLADQTLSEDGIIAVDDFLNTGWVDVTFATYDFLRVRDHLRPFALTSKKLYVARAAAVEKYQRALRARLSTPHIEVARILGHDVLVLRQPMVKRGFEVLRALIAEKF